MRVPPAGTWERRRADLYAAAEDWLGPPSPGLTEEQGIELLVRRRLGGFGPATRNEVADWAGLPVALVEPHARALEVVVRQRVVEIVRVHVDRQQPVPRSVVANGLLNECP